LDGEPELARAFVAREAWAHEAAYRLHGRVLYAAALGVLRDPQDAQDCVHDVLLRLWRNSSAFRSERGSLRAFLAVCVRNEALSRLRKSHNRDRIERSLRVPDTFDDVASGVAQEESIGRALAALTESQRQTVLLSYFGHLTHEEIAGELGEPVGTVKSRLSAALRRLRQALGPLQETTDVQLG
jgi:RNA polymerase sigma-70 factor (ECF subfamily)